MNTKYFLEGYYSFLEKTGPVIAGVFAVIAGLIALAVPPLLSIFVGGFFGWTFATLFIRGNISVASVYTISYFVTVLLVSAFL